MTGPSEPTEVHCLQCERVVTDDPDQVVTAEGSFCRSCFDGLQQDLKRVIEAQGADINYPSAALGGLAGGAVGVLVWWGFTVATKISFGLVAVVIGYAVGYGVVRFSGGKRSRQLSGLSVGIAVSCFLYAQYLVTRTYILRYFKQENPEDFLGPTLPLFPDPTLFVEVLKANFGVFDLVFLAIVAYQAWRIPAPPSFARLRS